MGLGKKQPKPDVIDIVDSVLTKNCTASQKHEYSLAACMILDYRCVGNRRIDFSRFTNKFCVCLIAELRRKNTAEVAVRYSAKKESQSFMPHLLREAVESAFVWNVGYHLAEINRLADLRKAYAAAMAVIRESDVKYQTAAKLFEIFRTECIGSGV